jgi:hypothetical protein
MPESEAAELLAVLKARFDANQALHPGLVWAKVQARLEAKAGPIAVARGLRAADVAIGRVLTSFSTRVAVVRSPGLCARRSLEALVAERVTTAPQPI